LSNKKQIIWPRVKRDILIYRLKKQPILITFQPMIWKANLIMKTLYHHCSSFLTRLDGNKRSHKTKDLFHSFVIIKYFKGKKILESGLIMKVPQLLH
jgi:hypothetical protein